MFIPYKRGGAARFCVKVDGKWESARDIWAEVLKWDYVRDKVCTCGVHPDPCCPRCR